MRTAQLWTKAAIGRFTFMAVGVVLMAAACYTPASADLPATSPSAASSREMDVACENVAARVAEVFAPEADVFSTVVQWAKATTLHPDYMELMGHAFAACLRDN